ncbi:hypothetical protein NBRC116188_28260 [Oceaniserpentilla sp. 4NH20-0058]|uniref:hypothetical protein n=1 Tax=Oceaniserpentilla sp. 4NH20-0058 TaxID=3127660 RepID=UPI00310B86BA
MKKLALLTCLYVLTGCGSDNDPSGKEGINTCAGYSSPKLVVEVFDSSTNAEISNAVVEYTATGEGMVSTQEMINAPYTQVNQNETENNLTYNYQSYFSVNAIQIEYSFTVSATGYHTHVSNQHSLELDSSCGAENLALHTVRLCPTSGTCL